MRSPTSPPAKLSTARQRPGTIDTLRLNAAGTYNLSGFTTITNIDAIAFNVNAAGFNLTVADSQVSTADANGDGTQNDLQISASVAMTNGVTISARRPDRRRSHHRRRYQSRRRRYHHRRRRRRHHRWRCRH